MKAHLPYIYRVEHVPKRRVKSRYAFGAGTIETDIPEISLSETEPALRFEYAIPRRDGLKVTPTEFRSWNGRLVTPVTDEDMPSFDPAWLPSSPGEPSARPFEIRRLYGFTHMDSHGDRIEYYAKGNMDRAAEFHSQEAVAGRLVKSTHDEDRSRVKQIADSLVVVEGKLWQKKRHVGFYIDMREDLRASDRPYWGSIVPDLVGYTPFTEFTVEDRKRFPCFRRGFDLSQMDRALYHAGERGVEWFARSLVIDDDSYLAYDGETDFICKAMDYAVLNSEDSVGEMASDIADARLSTRAAVERVREIAGSGIADREIESFRYLVKSLAENGHYMTHQALAACDDYMNDPWGRNNRNNGIEADKSRPGP